MTICKITILNVKVKATQEIDIKMSHFCTYLSLFLHNFVRFGLYIYSLPTQLQFLKN